MNRRPAHTGVWLEDAPKTFQTDLFDDDDYHAGS